MRCVCVLCHVLSRANVNVCCIPPWGTCHARRAQQRDCNTTYINILFAITMWTRTSSSASWGLGDVPPLRCHSHSESGFVSNHHPRADACAQPAHTLKLPSAYAIYGKYRSTFMRFITNSIPIECASAKYHFRVLLWAILVHAHQKQSNRTRQNKRAPQSTHQHSCGGTGVCFALSNCALYI